MQEICIYGDMNFLNNNVYVEYGVLYVLNDSNYSPHTKRVNHHLDLVVHIDYIQIYWVYFSPIYCFTHERVFTAVRKI